MAKRKNNAAETTTALKPKPETGTRPASAPVPLEEIPALACNGDFYLVLEKCRRLEEARAAAVLAHKEAADAAQGISWYLECSAGVKAVDLGDGTVLSCKSVPSPITLKMFSEFLDALLASGVDRELLKDAVDTLNWRRRDAGSYRAVFTPVEKGGSDGE